MQSAWALPAALAACGLVFLGDAAATSGPRTHSLETFALNFIALPIGALAFVAGILDARMVGHLSLATGAGVAIGAILAGRSLREVPWTGFASLAVAIAIGWFLDRAAPWHLSVVSLVAAVAVVFLIVYVLLYLVELPLRLAGLVSLPRPLQVLLGVAALGSAGYVALVGIA